MIDINDADVVKRRDTSTGRFLLFHRVDLPAKAILPWSGVVLDTGSDGIGLSVRLDGGQPSCWTAQDLLQVALQRAKDEEHRRLGPLVVDMIQHLTLAERAARRASGAPASQVMFVPGPQPSPYPWTIAVLGAHHLPLCSDPESREEGVTPEQLLTVVDQLLADADAPHHQRRLLRITRDHVIAALEGERQRVARVRASS